MPTTAKSDAEFAERFWSKVDRSGDCWLWTGARSGPGYGNVKHRQRVLASHRVAYELAVGPIPPGEMVLHRCDNPPCVRPDHLTTGRSRDNNQDCTAKTRNRREDTKVAKLTSAQVREIRNLYDAADLTQRQIAAQFGVSQVAVSHIVSRRTWAWVD